MTMLAENQLIGGCSIENGLKTEEFFSVSIYQVIKVCSCEIKSDSQEMAVNASIVKLIHINVSLPPLNLP